MDKILLISLLSILVHTFPASSIAFPAPGSLIATSIAYAAVADGFPDYGVYFSFCIPAALEKTASPGYSLHIWQRRLTNTPIPQRQHP